MMNSVLENFTILQVRNDARLRCFTRLLLFRQSPTIVFVQVVTNRETHETLLCTAYVFEVSSSGHGAQHHMYRLVKD